MKWKILAFAALYLLVVLGVVFFYQKESSTAYIESPGIHGPQEGREETKGNLTLTSADVILQNKVVSGNLYLSGNVRGGEVVLRGVEVTGSLVVINELESLVLEDTRINKLFINRGKGNLRVEARGSTTVGETLLEVGAFLKEGALAEGAAGFVSVVINSPGETTLWGHFRAVTMGGREARADLRSSRVDTLEVSQYARGSYVMLSGDSAVYQLIIDAPATISGEGFIGLALVNVKGAILDHAPHEIILAEGVSVMVSGEELTEEEEGPEGEEETPDEGEEKESPDEEPRERPQAPLEFQARYSAGANRVTMSWQPGDDHLTERYLITRRTGQGRASLLGGTRALSYNDSNVSPGVTYTYSLVAVCADGYFSHNVEQTVSIPQADPGPEPEPEPVPDDPEPDPVTLTINITGEGTVDGEGDYPVGTEVTLIAQAQEGWQFDRWEGSLQGSVSETTILMDSNHSVSAIFIKIEDSTHETS